ncbi:MAG: YhdH/YhfP family quinone oxidoreductase [Steroidobacteraceae bacterium]
MRLRALRIYQTDGEPSAAAVHAVLESMQLDALTPGDVLIRVQYSSINYKDALAVTGAGRILRRYPLNGGIDLAGIVVQSQDPGFQPGQAVLATGCGLSETLDGGYAEYARVPAAAVISMPAGLDALAAMTLGTAGFTAALAIHRMEQNGQTSEQGEIAVTGATGGVGSLAIDMLSGRGYSVCAITGKEAERAYLQQLGVQKISLRDELNLGQAALEPVRFAGAIDNLGGEWLSWLLRSTRLMGNVASIGMAAGSQLQTSVMPFILRGVNLLGITSANTPRPLRELIWQRLATDLKPAHLDVIRTRVVELAELPAVFADYLQGRVRGRTVVHVQD